MAKLCDPPKASSKRKRPSPRHPSAAITLPAFLLDAELITSDPANTFCSASERESGGYLMLLDKVVIVNFKLGLNQLQLVTRLVTFPSVI